MPAIRPRERVSDGLKVDGQRGNGRPSPVDRRPKMLPINRGCKGTLLGMMMMMMMMMIIIIIMVTVECPHEAHPSDSRQELPSKEGSVPGRKLLCWLLLSRLLLLPPPG
jgi:hypothetical protein